MKTGILYFTTCFHGFAILRHVDPFVRMLHILNSKSVQYYFIFFYIIYYFYYDNLCILYNIVFTAMHIISSLFIIISFDSIDNDVPVHYYIFVIDSMYCFIRIYVIVINMYALSMK